MSAPSSIKFNPFSQDFINDPFSVCKLIQEETPAFPVRGIGGNEWVVTRYADVATCLRNPNIVKVDILKDIKGRAEHARDANGLKHLADVIGNWMFFKVGEENLKFRKLLGPYFSPAYINKLLPEIEKIVQEVIAGLKKAESFDVLNDLAAVVTFKVICMTLGCPFVENQPTLESAMELFNIVNPPISLKRYKSMEKAAEYFVKTLELKPDADGDVQSGGLYQKLSQAVAHGELSKNEFIGTVSMLLSVGQDTAKHLIGNTIYALFKGGLTRNIPVMTDQELDALIMECGRQNAPVFVLPRMVTESTSVGDVPVSKGDRIFLIIGAACRDESVFDCADEIIPDREKRTKLMFGHGMHFCMGTYLAQQITRSLIKNLFREGTFSIADQSFDWLQSPGLRGLRELKGKFP